MLSERTHHIFFSNERVGKDKGKRGCWGTPTAASSHLLDLEPVNETLQQPQTFFIPPTPPRKTGPWLSVIIATGCLETQETK